MSTNTRWCKKCKELFTGDVCKSSHPNFMYTNKLPAESNADATAEVPKPAAQQPMAAALQPSTLRPVAPAQQPSTAVAAMQRHEKPVGAAADASEMERLKQVQSASCPEPLECWMFPPCWQI